ncbi:stealth family protein [Rhodohalobacter halophilus]|uniref:stealth family protein n=1 Tax=Rhodohalobacter halophilus TaxID=1812810 RepID=UPI00083FC952|nr:stealth family protein [Rhodohalobacter halophilus]
MAQNNHSSDPIDAVLTWVDGNDPKHAEKRAKAMNGSKNHHSHLPSGNHKTRFLNNGELYYSIASLRKFAPWIRTIYVVTDNQVPKFLTPEIQNIQNIKIVDHQEIFRTYEWALPTFSSMSIETALWRIEGLSTKFLYLNDDFILTAPVQIEDFFARDKVILRGRWKRMAEYSPLRIKLNHIFSRFVKKFLGITRSLNLLTQIRSAKLANFADRYFYTPHVPHPIRTKTVSDFYKAHPKTFENNIQHKFRSTDQHTIQYLANHIEIKKGNALLKPPDDVLMINGESDFRFMISKKIKRIKKGDVKFLCIQGFESIDDELQDELHTLLNDYFSDVYVNA